ncbi:MAG: ATP-binding cassette domain-containing protein [Candidatus Spyradosoma sp.]
MENGKDLSADPRSAVPAGTAVPVRVVSGEANLFLIRREADGIEGERAFVATLAPGDAFFPEAPLTPEGGDGSAETWRLGLVPAAANALETAPLETGSPEKLAEARDGWRARVRAGCGLAARELPDDADVPALLGALLRFRRNARDARRLRDAQNRGLTELALERKLEALGATAGISLRDDDAREHAASGSAFDPLLPALREIAEQYGLDASHAEALLEESAGKPTRRRLAEFADAAGWRMREIELADDFSDASALPILAFRRSDGAPLVLFLDGEASAFKDPARGAKKRPLTREAAASLEARAFRFYEPFPREGRTRAGLLRFLLRRSRSVIAIAASAGLISGLIGLVLPLATQYVTGEIIPAGNVSELAQVTALLVVLTTCRVAVGVVPSLVAMLFSARQFERFQAATYDHILRIPVNAFRRADSGDMTQRVLGASQVLTAVFGVISQQFVSSLFSLVSLGMMCWYSWKLALAGLAMALLYAFVFFRLSRANLVPLAEHAAAAGRMSGLLKQFFDGIGKIRAAGAERRVLSRFTDDFGEMTRRQYAVSRNASWQKLAAEIFPMLVSVAFYALAGGFLDETLSLPVFLAFMAAFQTFQTGLMEFSGGLWSLFAVKPEIDRIMPILETDPEDDAKRQKPGTLTGKVEVSHVNFRYAPESELVLRDVSFRADPGEFVAIVGPSGAGKSSLVRLLLGFETPEAGAVYYSDKDLARLDLGAVRRQMGVILQNNRILPASILENVVTGTDCTPADAWRALELAAFRREVEEMPMGIHTMVTPETISGGQQQRILIARALVGAPPVVVMDESTSALDNVSQEIVKSNMEKLRMTRIVIAHRLSTIVNADRIYVLDKGRVVQVGTYRELAARDGVFRRLVERQIA